MKIILKELKFYYLTVPKNNNERKKHLLEEFKEFNLTEVNPIPASYFNKNLKKPEKKHKSGATGWLKILDLASQEMGLTFKPFVVIEDDVKKYRELPQFIEIPENCDLLYIGLSEVGMANKKIGVKNSVCYKEIKDNNNIIRIYNMLSTHGIIISSLRGMLTLQKCIIEDFYNNRGWDITLARMHPYLNIYAIKEPLVYQFGKLGGYELSTKINYHKFNKKNLPEEWKKQNTLSFKSNYFVV